MAQQYISNPPDDLKLIQLAPESELKCGVITSSLENVQMDYRYGLEIGLDTLPQLQNLTDKLID